MGDVVRTIIGKHFGEQRGDGSVREAEAVYHRSWIDSVWLVHRASENQMSRATNLDFLGLCTATDVVDRKGNRHNSGDNEASWLDRNCVSPYRNHRLLLFA